jgi:hypothetical protein
MKFSSVFFILALILSSACSGLRKSPEMTSSGKAAYGVFDPDTQKVKKGKKGRAERDRVVKLKVDKSKTKGYSRSRPQPWIGS